MDRAKGKFNHLSKWVLWAINMWLTRKQKENTRRYYGKSLIWGTKML